MYKNPNTFLLTHPKGHRIQIIMKISYLHIKILFNIVRVAFGQFKRVFDTYVKISIENYQKSSLKGVLIGILIYLNM